jgi:hypothetical protein
MARCGCTDDETNRNVMRAGCGISVSGEGTNADPRRIELIASDCMCGVMQSCVTDRVCEGLSYRDGCLGLNIATANGNRLTLGSDGGLFADCGTLAVNECVAQVSALPAFVCGSTFGAGANVSEDNTLPSYVQAVTLGVDLTLASVVRLCDGAFYVAPARDLADIRYRVSTQSFVKPTGPVARTTTNNVLALQVDDDPTYGLCTTDDDGVIYGLAPLTGVLAETRTRVPLSIELPTGTGTSTTTQATVEELLDLLSQNCALDRALVHVDGSATSIERAWLSDFRGAGYQTAVYIANADQAAVHTAQQLWSEGVEWVYLHKNLPDNTIQTYVARGIQVLLAHCLQQVDVTRAEDLGARGVLADDPAWVCGDPCGSGLDSGSGLDPWCSDAVPSGQITASQIATGVTRGNRGSKFGGVGDCGWAMQTTGPLPARAQTTLIPFASWGRLGPPIGYTYTWEMRVEGSTLGRTSSELGLIIACTDDTLPLEGARTRGVDTLNPARVNGYALTSTLGWSAASTLMRIWKLTKGQAPVELGSFFQGGTPWTPGQWLRANVVVSETQIVFGLAVNDVGLPTWGTVTATDGEHRGSKVWAYAHAEGDNVPEILFDDYAFRNFVRY